MTIYGAPQVSVIVPTCGRPALLLECVRSILRSDFGDFEILIVDQDPAQSLRPELSKEFNGDHRIRYLCLDEAILSRARNLGIQHARGEILIFADDDIEVDPRCLSSYVGAFAAIQPTPGLVAGRLDPLWPCKRPDWLPEEMEYLLGIYSCGNELAPMPDRDLPVGANFAVLRKVVDDIGGFDERVGFSYARKTSMISGDDSLFSLRARQANYSVFYQPHARAWHKISEAKLTRRAFLKRSFWEGVSTLVVLYLSGLATRESFPRIVCVHFAKIGRQMYRILIPSSQRQGALSECKTWMRLSARCSHSAGVICCAVALLARQVLEERVRRARP